MTGTPIDVAGTTSVLGGIRAIASRAEIVAPMLLVAVVNALNGAEGWVWSSWPKTCWEQAKRASAC
ncbi:MAG: hypothetical protein R2733_08080 [Acidimicrobiales bacterium]